MRWVLVVRHRRPEDMVLVHHLAGQVVAKRFGRRRVEAGDELVFDAVRARYRSQRPILIQLPEQHLARANEGGHALRESSVERAESGARPRMGRDRHQGFDRQLTCPLDVQRRPGALLVEHSLLFAPIEVRAHVNERLDELLPALLEARNLQGCSHLVGEDRQRAALHDRVDGAPGYAEHADDATARLQVQADVRVQAGVGHACRALRRPRERCRSEKLVDLVASDEARGVDRARIHLLAVAGVVDQGHESHHGPGQLKGQLEGLIRDMRDVRGAGNLGRHRLKCLEPVPQAGLRITRGLQGQEPNPLADITNCRASHVEDASARPRRFNGPTSPGTRLAHSVSRSKGRTWLLQRPVLEGRAQREEMNEGFGFAGGDAFELTRLNRALTMLARPSLTDDWPAPMSRGELLALGVFTGGRVPPRKELIERLWNRKRQLLRHAASAFDLDVPPPVA